MADGGASSFILLATALLISGSVSAVLINQYGDLAQTMGKQQKGEEANRQTSFEFSGDLSNVAYDTSNPIETMTFYLQNTGVYILDEDTLFIQVDGQSISAPDVFTTVLPLGGDWGNNDLLEVVISGAWGLPDNSDVKFSVLVESTSSITGYSGKAVDSVEVRLNELS